MEQHIPTVIISCLAVGVFVVAVLLLRQRHVTARLRERNIAMQGDLHARDEETRHLVTTRLPALVDSLHHDSVEVPGPLRPGSSYESSFQQVMDMFAGSVDRAEARAGQSAKATLKATMRAVQSLANEQQLAISNMQDRHDNPDVLEDLLKIDHMNAQLGRRAQATAVLCGSWPGQQRSASPLTDVVRGATSRIRDYLRVQFYAQTNTAVVSRVVEPVVLTVAELLDNAARHSQPNTSVEVNISSAHNGVAIVIDDAGVAMDAEETQRAAELLAGRQSADINELGDPPRIGFAVVGVLAARYGFRVSVDTRSPYGGVRSVVFLPTALLTHTDRPEAVVRAETVVSAEAVAPPSAYEAPKTEPSTMNGLPKRHRVSAAEQQPAAEQPTGSTVRPAREIAAGLGAWQRGTRSGREGGFEE